MSPPSKSMECCECHTTSVTEIILLTGTKTLIVCNTVWETLMLNVTPSTRFLWGRPTMTIREKETSREGERNLDLDLDREGRLSDLSSGGRAEVQKVEHINSVKCSSSSFWFVVLTAQPKFIIKCYLESIIKIHPWIFDTFWFWRTYQGIFKSQNVTTGKLPPSSVPAAKWSADTKRWPEIYVRLLHISGV